MCDVCGAYKKNIQNKFKASIVKWSLCACSDVYIIVSGTVTIVVAGTDDTTKRFDKRNKGVIFKNNSPFTNNSQIENVKNLDVTLPMYNLIEHSDNYSKSSGRLWQYYRDGPSDNILESE